MKRFTTLFICLSFWSYGQSQSPFAGDNKEEKFFEGSYFFDHSLYGISALTYKDYINTPKSSVEGNFQKLKNEASFNNEIAELYLELPQASNQLHYSIDKHLPDPVALPAILEMGRYFYNQREYKNCVAMYNKAEFNLLPSADQVEHRFNKGYCLFVMKEFEKAKQEFLIVKKEMGLYYFHIHYYLGLSEYFTGNNSKAIQNFQIAEQTGIYKPYIPYYICQIYFKEGKNKELIVYGEQSLKNQTIKNRNQIRLLLGQAYFKENDLVMALPHFESYSKEVTEKSVEEFYQIGYTFYKNEKYDLAIEEFDAIHLEKSEFGQLANYYLADCYLKKSDNKSARIAFKNVSQMDYIPSMKHEAAFNYAKLTAESGIEREAINALENIEENSKYYKESRDILADVLEKSADLYHVISIIEKQKKLTPKLKAVLQKAHLQAGHKSYADQNMTSSEQHYTKSLQYPESEIYETEAIFWIAQIKQNTMMYDASIQQFDKYFNIGKIPSVSPEASPFMANYAQGYNYLKKLNYKKALEYFQKTISLFQQNSFSSQPWKNITSDAYIRSGDCAFKERDYVQARKYYQTVIDKKWKYEDYALYQKGLLLGLQNEPYEKIVVLKELTSKFKNSEYLDLSYIQIGDTYSSLNSLDNAYNAYQDLVKKFGTTSELANEARLKSALIAYNKGDLTVAIKQYKEVLSNKPSPQETQAAVTGLEEIYMNDLGKPDEYLAILEKLPNYKANDYSADSLHFKVGEVRFLNGEYEKDIESFTTYIQKFPKGYYKSNAFYFRAESRAVLKKYAEALDDYAFVLLDSGSSYYESALKKAAIITFNHTQDFKQSFLYYDKYFQISKVESEKLWAANGAIRSAFKNNDKNGVQNYGEKILSMNSADQEDKALASYFTGKMLYNEKQLDQALTCFQKIGNDINLSQAAEARFWIGDILIKQNKWEEAEIHCNNSNEVNKYYPYWIARTVLLLSDIYVHKKDLYSARAAIEAVLENFGDDAGLVKLAKERLAVLETLEKDNSKIKAKPTNQLILDNRKNE
ncbi:MAG: tetratricopeptide repeat protein [Saprospiraceae bacterium]|nr:tetratricopeptide repeat protein [Saprospiraceae bacterium]